MSRAAYPAPTVPHPRRRSTFAERTTVIEPPVVRARGRLSGHLRRAASAIGLLAAMSSRDAARAIASTVSARDGLHVAVDVGVHANVASAIVSISVDVGAVIVVASYTLTIEPPLVIGTARSVTIRR
jgi:hypothetical protein